MLSIPHTDTLRPDQGTPVARRLPTYRIGLPSPASDPRFDRYTRERRAHYDAVAAAGIPTWGEAYHRRIAEVYRFLVAPGLRVLELGCGEGDLLAALDPSFGVGVDLSVEMVRRAAERHPGLQFLQADVHQLSLSGPFDVIILSDLVNDLWDVQTVLQQVARLCDPQTRVIINCYSRVWEQPLRAARGLGLARPNLEQNWLTVEDVAGLLGLADFELVRSWQEVLWPFATPGVASLAFSYLLGQPVKDTLCGTKAIWRADYLRIAQNRSYFGDFDPFGDFDLLFGAARLGLKIVDLPIRYRERLYGATNIDRWRHGALLLRMTAFAALRLKFI